MKKFILIAFVASGISSPLIAESAEHWYVEENRDSFVASINGEITFGDRLSVRFSPDDCHNLDMFLTVTTAVNDPNWEALEVVNNYLPITWNGELGRVILVKTFPFLNYEVAHINLGHYEIGNLIEVMNSTDEITIEIVDFNFFVASEYFDIPTNYWTTNGAVIAFTEAYTRCNLN